MALYETFVLRTSLSAETKTKDFTKAFKKAIQRTGYQLITSP